LIRFKDPLSIRKWFLKQFLFLKTIFVFLSGVLSQLVKGHIAEPILFWDFSALSYTVVWNHFKTVFDKLNHIFFYLVIWHVKNQLTEHSTCSPTFHDNQRIHLVGLMFLKLLCLDLSKHWIRLVIAFGRIVKQEMEGRKNHLSSLFTLLFTL
jgi:hypothetical protein